MANITINSAKFIKSAVSVEGAFEKDFPHIAFIGRSNVGKSSTINTLTKTKNLAKTSSFPGRTRQINLFLINNKYYFVDLPGYGYSKMSLKERDNLTDMIDNYLFNKKYTQAKVVLIIDALVGVTDNDMEMLQALEQNKKEIIVVANKIDKVKPSDKNNQIKKIEQTIGAHKIIFFSAEKKIGIGETIEAIFS